VEVRVLLMGSLRASINSNGEEGLILILIFPIVFCEVGIRSSIGSVYQWSGDEVLQRRQNCDKVFRRIFGKEGK
jgi:hypothetical protein